MFSFQRTLFFFALFKVLLSKFGKVLIDGCSDTCYNKTLIETLRRIGHKKSKPSENTSDHFIVSKEILKTVCALSVPSLFQFIGVTDREFITRIRDSSGISKQTLIQLMLPYKISCN